MNVRADIDVEKASPHTSPNMLKIDHAVMIELWADGVSASDLAKRFGVTRRTIYNFAEYHRDQFPVRQHKKPFNHVVRCREPKQAVASPPKKAKPLSPDHVRRTTISGAVVTLPRIPTIDGYAA